jgi:hypothetical protein
LSLAYFCAQFESKYFKMTKYLFQRLLFKFCLIAIATTACAQDELKNLPEYSLPLTNKKLVIAHNMTNIIRYKGHELEDSANPKYYLPIGNASASLGGLTQVKVMADSLMQNASLDDAVAFEMKAAIRSGIDGFQFYYVLGAKDWDNIIKAYFRVAAQQKLDFKLTLCISHPDGGTEKEKVKEFADRINGIMKEVGRDNPHWLRTPDGRLIIYLWLGDGIADIPIDKEGKPNQFYIARAYKRLADAVNEKFACIFTINEQITEKKLNQYLDYFPATWIWTLAYNKNYIGNLVANTCIKRKRTFTGSAFGDFYTSKLLKKGTWDMYHKVEDAVKDGLSKVERRYLVTGLSYNFRKLLEFGIEKDVPIMNVITWNDYPEGHHLAPEVNHNYGFCVLLNYYKNLWKNQPTTPSNDIAIVFFKKYKHGIKPSPYGIPVYNFQEGAVNQKVEDSIDVVTILQEDAILMVNGEKINVKKGLVSTKFSAKPGAVKVEIWRNNKQTLVITSKEWITSKPYRTDQLTYIFSSEDLAYHEYLFGKTPPIYSTEYNENINPIK